MRKMIKIIGVIVSIAMLFGAFAIAMVAFPVFGNSALIVRSGSMEPNIPVGSVIVVRPAAPATSGNLYDFGDVISFKIDEKTIVTHRVVEVLRENGQVAYKTKGDANEEADNWTVASGDVVGKSYLIIPEFGKLLSFARSKYGFPLLIIFPAVLVILIEGVNIVREVRKNVRRSNTRRNRIVILSAFAPLVFFSSMIQATSAFFSDTETSRGNFFQAAATFVDITPTPTPTETPGGIGCGDINVDISGNGIGSVNNITIFCRNWRVIRQWNRTEVINDIKIETNTGNNSTSQNNHSSIFSGSSSSSVSIDNNSGSGNLVGE